MSDPKNPNPFAPPAEASEAQSYVQPDEHAANSARHSASVLWTIPGGATGATIGALLIGRPDELLGGADSVIAMILLLTAWGFIGLVGTMIWRIPRYWLWGPIRTHWTARFLSGVMLFVSCVVVLQMGRTRMIDLPEPAMGITMIGMLLMCVVGCVEFEAWTGGRKR